VNRRNDQPLIGFPQLAHQPLNCHARLRWGLARAKPRLMPTECVLTTAHRRFSRDHGALALGQRAGRGAAKWGLPLPFSARHPRWLPCLVI
jgi:hypothetical protein